MKHNSIWVKLLSMTLALAMVFAGVAEFGAERVSAATTADEFVLEEDGVVEELMESAGTPGAIYEAMDLSARNKLGGLKINARELTREEVAAEKKKTTSSVKAKTYSSEWDKYATKYIYNQLNDDWKATWDEVYASMVAIADNETSYVSGVAFDLPEGTTGSEAIYFWKVFRYCNPQFFFIENSFSYGYEYLKFYIYDAFCDGAPRKEAVDLAKTKIAGWVAYVDQGKTEFEKAIRAHDLITSLVYYNYNSLNNSDDNGDWTQSIYSFFVDNYYYGHPATVCSGYAQMFATLMNACGVDTICLTGSQHAWSNVRINNSWYCVDCTWDDPDDTSNNDLTKSYYYSFRTRAFYDQIGGHVTEDCWFFLSNVPSCIMETGANSTTPGTIPASKGTVSDPAFAKTQNGDTYTVTIKTTTAGAKIYYTTDGSDPSEAFSKSTLYVGPFTATNLAKVKAIAVLDGYKDSAIVAGITDPKVDLAAPTISAIANAATGVKLTWSKVTGAGNYVIYKYVGGQYTPIGTTTSTTFTDTTATKTGTKYYYKVAGGKLEDGIQYTGTQSAAKSIYFTATPTGLVATNLTNGVKLDWTAVSGATGYVIYRSDNGGTAVKVATVKTNTYSDTKATSVGTEYTYSVYAYFTASSTNYLSSKATVAIKRANNVSIVSLANSDKGLTLTWEKIGNVTGYVIYRSVDDGAYSKLKTVAVSTTSYTDTTAETGKKYSYKIRYYVKDFEENITYGKYCSAKSIYCARKVTLSSIGNTEDGMKIAWDKVSGAKGYVVYRSTDGTTYTKLGTATTTSYEDTTVKAGSKYYYKVSSYVKGDDKNYYSVQSAAKSYYRVDEVGIEEVKNTTSGVSIKLNAVSGVTGYRIYRSINDGAFENIATISSTSYLDTTAKTGGTKYTYKVYAYKTVSGTNYYAAPNKRLTIYAPATSISAVTNVATGVSISWKATTGVTGYAIYRSIDGSPYTLLKNTTATSYIDTAAVKTNFKYSYVVYSYVIDNGRVYYSPVSAAKYTYGSKVQTTLAVTNNVTKGITATWTADPEATGFVIQYSLKSDFSDYTNVKVTGGATSSQRITGLTVGQTYYVRIRTYVKVNGVNYWSAWSTAKTVKIVK